MDRSYQYVIVGSGAGGAAAAYRLARSGAEVLLLERGGPLPADGSTLDPDQVLRQGRFKSDERWHDGAGRAFVPEECFNLGGKTRWYGAALARFGNDEFGADPERGFLPWPIGPEELAPYYEEAEALLGIQPFELEPDLARICGRIAATGSGWRLEPLRLGLAPDILTHPDQAVRFDGFALTDGLKADADSRFLRRVADRGNLTVLTGAHVTDLVGRPGSPDTIAGARCADGRTFYCDRLLLAGGALHSPRLLQRHLVASGLEDALLCADQVGRNYKRHVLSAVLGFAPRRQTDLLRKTVLLLNDRYRHSSVQPLGGWIDREIVKATLPRWIPKAVRECLSDRVYGFFLQTEDGSHPGNRVSERGSGELPLLDYDGTRTPHAEREHRALVGDFKRRLIRAGMLPFSQRIGLAGSAHSVGTLCAGDDPRRAVVDAEGRVFGMKNLYVVDGSVLPRIGRLNPALSIYAWSLRVADRLIGTTPR